MHGRTWLALGAIAVGSCTTESSSSSSGGAASQSSSSADAASASSATSVVTTTQAVSSVETTAVDATSGSAGGAGPCDLFQPTAPSQSDCAGYCERLAEAACANDPTVADCTAACEEEVRYYAPGCETETVAYLACLAVNGETACNADGLSTIGGCAPEHHAFQVCTVCVAVPTTSACGCCEVDACCAQSTELVENPDFDAYVACRTACGPNPGCWEDCDAMYPDTGADFDQYNFCINGSCGGPCFGD